MTYSLAIDLGATSGRSILASYDGARVEMRELTRFPHPMLPIGGHTFWNLPGLYAEVLRALKAAAEEMAQCGGELATIGIDTWGCDMAYFYADGTIASLPFCYRDPHTDGAAQRFNEKMPLDEVYQRTGIQMMDFNTLFQLDTIRQHNPALIAAADKILFMPDALTYMLTGEAVCERTVASTSQMLNPHTGQLDEELLKAIGIPAEKFGRMVEPGTIAGRLSAAVQQATGLKDVPVVAVAGHDTASAVVAIPAADRNFAYLSCGTWSLLGVESPEPVITETSRAYNFTNEGSIDGEIRLLKNITGLWIFEQCRKEFKGVPENVNLLNALCMESTCAAVIDPEDPAFAHPASMTRAINDYCAQHGQPAPKCPADYLRVIFRSLALKYKEQLARAQEISGKHVERLQVIGGGSRNTYLMQFTANALQMPVVAGPTESTALGNILLQLRATGQVDTLQAMRTISINSTETRTFMPEC